MNIRGANQSLPIEPKCAHVINGALLLARFCSAEALCFVHGDSFRGKENVSGCTSRYAHMRNCTCTCTCTHAHAHAHVHTHACTCICVCKHIRIVYCRQYMRSRSGCLCQDTADISSTNTDAHAHAHANEHTQFITENTCSEGLGWRLCQDTAANRALNLYSIATAKNRQKPQLTNPLPITLRTE